MFWPVLVQLLFLVSPETPVPGCRQTCGNVTVPYPFGIGDRRCFKEPSHELFCDESQTTPQLLLGPRSKVPVLNISLEGQMTVSLWVAHDCYNSTGASVDSFNQIITLGKVYSFSDTRNKFTALGCDTKAFMSDPLGEMFQSGCVSFCINYSHVISGSCSGIGCCQTSIPAGLRSLNIDLGSYCNHTLVSNFNPCSYAFLADQEWFKFNFSDLWDFKVDPHLYFQNRTSSPVILDWVFGLETCEEAAKNSSFVCGKNSFCSNSTNGPGHRCFCNKGYQGSPYLSKGCHDIDECADPENNPCEGICNNTPGSYFCSCPVGTIDDGRQDGIRCVPSHEQFLLLHFVLGIGLGVLFFLVAGFWIYWGLQRRKLIKLKEKFFKQNGGLLLQHHLSMRDGPVESRNIFTAVELERATNNYDESLVVGRGGYGTVYKGILENKRVVAIKKSKVIDKTQIEQFINEVVILSQINHKNVVKLLGCCLETEVPLLVYEFINNGTLYHHIHSSNSSLSWEDRLRIAAETAGALAYLHSAASLPIIHRDINCTNILLDENKRAKVSDFGVSRLVPLDKTQLSTLVQGTLGYLDPEYFLTSQLTEKSDVYSFGVVLVELLTGKKVVSFERPLEERNLAMMFILATENDCLPKILDSLVAQEIEGKQLIDIAELARKCLLMSGKARPTMKEVAMELERLRTYEKQPCTDQGRKSLVDYFLLRQQSESQDFSSIGCNSFGGHVPFESERGR